MSIHLHLDDQPTNGWVSSASAPALVLTDVEGHCTGCGCYLYRGQARWVAVEEANGRAGDLWYTTWRLYHRDPDACGAAVVADRAAWRQRVGAGDMPDENEWGRWAFCDCSACYR